MKITEQKVITWQKPSVTELSIKLDTALSSGSGTDLALIDAKP